jgi:hypothetical protein
MQDKKHKVSDLNAMYLEGEAADQELFAEQRSNIQLVMGQHYGKKNTKFWDRLRTNKDVSNEQKIRLTKNHIRKVVHIYRNSITSYAPGVTAQPKDKSNMQNQKAAELVNAVWADYKTRQDWTRFLNNLASDYVGIGEVAVKIFFDPLAGKFLGYEQEVDETGQPVFDETGQPAASQNARFSGDVKIERLFSFNIIRPAGAKSLDEAEWLCHRKMVDIKDLKNMINASEMPDEEKQKTISKISETQDQTYVVLDGSTGNYKQTKNQTMIKEWFFKSCPQYPMGYFYITCGDVSLFEGELPFGVFPIVMTGFDEVPTSPRFRSIVKQLRPNQVEINRVASTIAETQITLGWDKVLVQNGTKLLPGTSFPGVRSFQYSGIAPIVLEGRTGAQYLEYMNSQIDELYRIALIDEQQIEKEANFDVYSMLNRSIKDKKKFSLYTDGFEGFLRKVFSAYIALRQKYSTPEDLIPAIGKSEAINVQEFKGVSDLSYSIVAEPQTGDAESKLGKQMMIQHVIQFVGTQLAQKDLGKLIRMMPYANDEKILEDMTMEYDFVENLMLAIERGEAPQINNNVDCDYVINKLVSRTVKSDYQFLSPQVQQMYQNTIKTYEQVKADQLIKLKQAQSEFIPSSGYLVACDFYVTDPASPEKLPKRARIPSEALDWLLKQLQAQGTTQETMTQMPQGAATDIIEMAGTKAAQQMAQQAVNQPQTRTQTGLAQQAGPPNPEGAYRGY